MLSYASRTAPVRLRLTSEARGGERGERDVLRGFESAEGGSDDDELEGAAGPNRLVGGPGDDRLSGRGGDDRLDGQAGADLLRAGSGDDVIVAPSRGDRVACGPGFDALRQAAARITVPADCDSMSSFFLQRTDESASSTGPRSPSRRTPQRAHGARSPSRSAARRASGSPARAPVRRTGTAR